MGHDRDGGAQSITREGPSLETAGLTVECLDGAWCVVVSGLPADDLIDALEGASVIAWNEARVIETLVAAAGVEAPPEVEGRPRSGRFVVSADGRLH